MSFMENMNLLTLVKISKYKSSHKQKVLIDLEVTLFLCLLTSERGPFRALKLRPVRQEAAFGTARL